MEHLAAGDECLLALFGRIGRGHDVDGLSGELAVQADILAAAADGERKLIVGNDDLDPLLLLVDDDARDLRGLERVDDEGGGVFRPGDDVDLLALHFLHDGLHAAALHADARSEEHTSELQSLMRISYAVFCLKKTNNYHPHT